MAANLISQWKRRLLSNVTRVMADESETVTYDQVRPVFRKHCLNCHNQERARGDLNLSSLDGIKAGSTSGVAAVAGKPEESPIYLSAAHLEDPKMPPNAPKIPQRELDLIRRWIAGGMMERGAIANQPAAKMLPIASTPQPTGTTFLSRFNTIEPLARPAPITALATSPTAPLIAVSGRRQIVLADGSSAAIMRALPFPDGDIFALRFSQSGKLLFAGGGVGGQSGKVIGFDVATGERLYEVGDETDCVLAIDISRDAKFVAVGGPNRPVKVYRVSGGEPLLTLRKHTDWILSLAYSPDGLLLASSDRFGGVQV